MAILGVSPEVWFPVASLALGAILKAVFDVFSERRGLRRDFSLREEERRQTLKLKRLEFQHVTLWNFRKCSQGWSGSLGRRSTVTNFIIGYGKMAGLFSS